MIVANTPTRAGCLLGRGCVLRVAAAGAGTRWQQQHLTWALVQGETWHEPFAEGA